MRRRRAGLGNDVKRYPKTKENTHLLCSQFESHNTMDLKWCNFVELFRICPIISWLGPGWRKKIYGCQENFMAISVIWKIRWNNRKKSRKKMRKQKSGVCDEIRKSKNKHFWEQFMIFLILDQSSRRKFKNSEENHRNFMFRLKLFFGTMNSAPVHPFIFLDVIFTKKNFEHTINTPGWSIKYSINRPLFFSLFTQLNFCNPARSTPHLSLLPSRIAKTTAQTSIALDKKTPDTH